MRFAYYIPRLASNEVTDEKLVELGLGDRFRDCFGRLSGQHIARSNIHSHGPDGANGAWVYPSSDAAPLLWKPAAWESSLSDNGQFYLCWQKGATTDPEQLKRRKIVDGCDVEMLDGKLWHCPTIRRCLARPNVPCSYERKNGEVTRQVVPSYKSIWDASGKWAAEYFGSGLDEIKLVDIASKCVSLNYRVGDEELRMLSLFDHESMKRVLEVAIDFDFVRDAVEDQKKSGTSDGLLPQVDLLPGDAA